MMTRTELQERATHYHLQSHFLLASLPEVVNLFRFAVVHDLTACTVQSIILQRDAQMLKFLL